MRELASLLILVVWVGLVQAEDAREVVVESAKELKGINAKKITWKKDGAKMILVPGEYEEKKTYDRLGRPITKRVKVEGSLGDYWMDATEVTVSQFKKFLTSTDYQFEGEWWEVIYKYSPTDKHPMIYVSWHDAAAFAKWAEKRLPTEAEWVFAARGGLIGREYSWGDDETEAQDYANFAGTGGKDEWDESTTPVGSLKSNGYGLYDMAGNVWEWSQDWYGGGKDLKVWRGGAWNFATDFLSVASPNNSSPDTRYYYRGFRCVSGYDGK